ncbi:hypothetical protein ACE3MS_15255 [Paenibacillus dendritiformis]|uniref:hypothetical protein n=1 Tax=Paenibacillus dendritiformis TaxID=130049 RepID=UPI00365C3073
MNQIDEQRSKKNVRAELKKESADIASEVEKGEMTMNQARAKFGLDPLDDPAADAFLKKETSVSTEVSRACPMGCDFKPIEADDRFCGKCGSKLTLQ